MFTSTQSTLNDSGASQTSKQGRETIIENAIIDRPDLLRFPGALAIRNWRVAPHVGRCDVGLFPPSGPVKLVLVEAKGATAPDAASKCVGQLIMYYAGALRLGSDGLNLLRTYAREHKKDIRDTTRRRSLCMLAGAKNGDRAWERLSRGKPLEPREVRLFLALDGDSHQSLKPILECLNDHHHLSIGLVVVRNGRIVGPVAR